MTTFIYFLLIYFWTALAEEVKIFIADLNPGWPTTFAPILPLSLTVSNETMYFWKFNGVSAQACVSKDNIEALPCQGRVVQYLFQRTGTYEIELKILNSGRGTIHVKSMFEIKDASRMVVAWRPEIRSLPMDRWKVMVDAYYFLKRIGVYDTLAIIHENTFRMGKAQGTRRSAAHSGPSFLVWHRASTRIVERCLQVAMNDEALGIPYIDWTMGWMGIDRYIGGNGDDTEVVPDGPFCNHPTSPNCPRIWVLPDTFPDPVKAIKRKLNSDESFTFVTRKQIETLFNMPFYDLPPFDNTPTEGSFRNAIEGWLSEGNDIVGSCHNGFHRWVGGTMAKVDVSFNDPLFQFHHCQVDRLFTYWQRFHDCDKGQGNAVCYRPGDVDLGINASIPGAVERRIGDKLTYALPGHMFSDTMYPWKQKISDVLVANQGYDYLLPGQLPPPPSPVPRLSVPTQRARYNGAKIVASSIIFHATFTITYTMFILIP